MDLSDFRDQTNAELAIMRANTEPGVVTLVNFIFYANEIPYWKAHEPIDHFERATLYRVDDATNRIDFIKRADGFRGCLLPLVSVETRWARDERLIGYRFSTEEASANTLVVPESIKPQIIVHHLLSSEHAQ